MKKLILASAVLIGTVCASQAGGFHISVGIGLPLVPPVVVAPPVYAPAPPPVYVPACPPRVVYSPAPPVWVAPAPAFYFGCGPGAYGHGHYAYRGHYKGGYGYHHR